MKNYRFFQNEYIRYVELRKINMRDYEIPYIFSSRNVRKEGLR